MQIAFEIRDPISANAQMRSRLAPVHLTRQLPDTSTRRRGQGEGAGFLEQVQRLVARVRHGRNVVRRSPGERPLKTSQQPKPQTIPRQKPRGNRAEDPLGRRSTGDLRRTAGKLLEDNLNRSGGLWKNNTGTVAEKM